jgi:hypothetical protein
MALKTNRALLILPLLATSLAAQSPLPPAEQQIAAAVLPLPSELRAGATVMGYRETSRNELVVLRNGTNGMTCLALYVVREDFHVACYQDGLEPFMARGRALRVEGVRGAQVDSVRFRELRTGALTMPPAAALYSLTARKEDYDAATNTVKGARPLFVVYVPGATPESLGISAQPSATAPWLMFPGTPKAHIMITGTMTP